MKKILFFTLIFSLQAVAQNKNIRSPLNDKKFNNPIIRMFPKQGELTADCKKYAEFLMINAAELTADGLEFARTLSLRGQMKNSFEADFLLGAVANVEITKLQEVVISEQSGSFTEISTRLGLTLAPVEVYQNAGSIYIKVRSRDIMCDLLANKIELTANAQVTLLLSESETAFQNQFYEDIHAATAAALTENDNNFVKAAFLGLAYTGIFRKHNLPAAETKENLIFLFSALFKSGSLEPHEHQEVQTRRALGLTPVILKAAL